MEKRLKLVRLLSLEEIALRRVSVLLCCNHDSRALFWEPLRGTASPTKIKEWQNVVEAKMSELVLPESLKKQIIGYVPSIGFGVRRWRDMHVVDFEMRLYDISLTDLSKLCWTSAGLIDHRKTAEQLVSCHLLSVERRYDFASFYCLENDIRPLWEDLPEEQKELYRTINRELYRTRKQFLRFCWPRILKGELSELDFLWRGSGRNLTSFHQWAFEEAAKRHNQVASEYFFHLLTPGEREASLMRTVRSAPNDSFFLTLESRSDMLHYLLSVMTPEQQMEIVRTRPVDVLLCFLDWKRLHLFSENAALVWPFVTRDSYGDLLLLVFELISLEDCYVPRLLRELFEHCPLDFKEYFVAREAADSSYRRFLYNFSCRNDPESLRVMFSFLDAADRASLLFSDGVLEDLYSNIRHDRWQMVEVCLREADLSMGDREGLGEAFTRKFGEIIAAEEKCRRFFELLHETDDVKKNRQRKPESCNKE